MIKKRILLPLLLILALTLTACTTDDGNVDPDPGTPPVEDPTLDDETIDEEVTDNEITDDKTTGENVEGENQNFKIKAEEAFDKYMDKHSGTKIKKVQLDRDNGKYIYEVEGFDAEKEYELKIDPETGEIIKEDIDDDTNNNDDEEVTRADVEKVQEIVDKAIKEAGEGAIFEKWTLKVKNGKARLEVEMERNGNEDIEYTYDVETGELLEKDN